MVLGFLALTWPRAIRRTTRSALAKPVPSTIALLIAVAWFQTAITRAAVEFTGV